MVYINDIPFYEEPGSCGTCEFFNNGSSALCPQDKGMCLLFMETHHSWCNPPSRCAKIFRKAFKAEDGARLVIVKNE